MTKKGPKSFKKNSLRKSASKVPKFLEGVRPGLQNTQFKAAFLFVCRPLLADYWQHLLAVESVAFWQLLGNTGSLLAALIGSGVPRLLAAFG